MARPARHRRGGRLGALLHGTIGRYRHGVALRGSTGFDIRLLLFAGLRSSLVLWLSLLSLALLNRLLFGIGRRLLPGLLLILRQLAMTRFLSLLFAGLDLISRLNLDLRLGLLGSRRRLLSWGCLLFGRCCRLTLLLLMLLLLGLGLSLRLSLLALRLLRGGRRLLSWRGLLFRRLLRRFGRLTLRLLVLLLLGLALLLRFRGKLLLNGLRLRCYLRLRRWLLLSILLVLLLFGLTLLLRFRRRLWLDGLGLLCFLLLPSEASAVQALPQAALGAGLPSSCAAVRLRPAVRERPRASGLCGSPCSAPPCFLRFRNSSSTARPEPVPGQLRNSHCRRWRPIWRHRCSTVRWPVHAALLAAAGSNASDKDSSGNAALANSLDRFPICGISFSYRYPPSYGSQPVELMPHDPGRFSVPLGLNRGNW